MADVTYLLAVFAFFVLCVGYVRLCDRIIGADEAQGAYVEPQRTDVEPTAADHS